MITVWSTTDEVHRYIHNLQIEDFKFDDVSDNFQLESVTGKVLLNLQKSELNDLGIFELSRRNALHQHIMTLRGQDINKGFDSPVTRLSLPRREEVPSDSTPDHELEPPKRPSARHPLNIPGPGIPKMAPNSQPVIISPSFATNGPPASTQPISSVQSMPILAVGPLPGSMKSYGSNSSLSSLSSLGGFPPNLYSIPPPPGSTMLPVPMRNGLVTNRPLATGLGMNAINPAAPPMLMNNVSMNGVGTTPVNQSESAAQTYQRQSGSRLSISTQAIMEMMQNQRSDSRQNSITTLTPSMSNSDTTNPTSQVNPEYFQRSSQQSRPSDVSSSASTWNPFLGPNAKSEHGHSQLEVPSDATLTASKVPTEPCYYQLTRVDMETVKFIGVYRGINSSQQLYVLMQQCDVLSFNHLMQQQAAPYFDEWSMMQQPEVLQLDVYSVQQVFNSKMRIYKYRCGWDINGALLPFNAICTFTFNLKSKDITSMNTMEVEGVINNIDHNRQLMWVSCPLQVEAVEWRHEHDPEDKCGVISKLRFIDNRNVQRLRRNASYLVHEWDALNVKGMGVESGDFVRCGLKLSTKTNRKIRHAERSVFVQAWNMRTQRKSVGIGHKPESVGTEDLVKVPDAKSSEDLEKMSGKEDAEKNND